MCANSTNFLPQFFFSRHTSLGIDFRYRFPAKCEPSHLCNFNMEGPLKMIPKCTVNDGFRKWRKMNVVMSRHVGALAHAFRKLPRCQLQNPGSHGTKILGSKPLQTLEPRPEIPGSKPLQTLEPRPEIPGSKPLQTLEPRPEIPDSKPYKGAGRRTATRFSVSTSPTVWVC
jgi:hypothetical protein